MTRTQLQQMDDIALCEAAERTHEFFERAGYQAVADMLAEIVHRFRPHAQAPDAYPFPTHEEEPTL